MDPLALRRARLRHHRLNARASSVADAARHLTATQSQDLWGGRLALASRTRGAAVSHVDRAYDRGAIVRAWTQRGTLHTVAADDLAWILSVTGPRMLVLEERRMADLGLSRDDVARAEAVARGALRGGGRLTRAEIAAVWESGGVATAGQRTYHLIAALAVVGVLVWGPVVHRAGVEPREQHLVLAEDWITASTAPADPEAELFVRYIAGHGPATVRDYAWWAGLALTPARAAAERAADRVRTVADEGGDPLYASASPPRASADAPRTIALPTFEEYYIAYADRGRVCTSEVLAAAGPGANGMVRPVIVHDGEIVGLWRPPAMAVRATGEASFELLEGADGSPEDVQGAVDRALHILRS
ncbi:winged helix DNA-binding domain-containing protein [Microbacterium gilvum]|uniref:Winged helix DNA-binding domain-containing protein n=1 Tax=Microbacterium gilvum TaxID=1336204 RepID=A0ABP9AJX4_9MICO